MSQEYRPAPGPTSRPPRRWARFWPAVVPLAWCAVVWGVMSPDAIRGRPEVPERLKWLVYDESDLTALALRGANAHARRLPGRTDEPDWLEPDELAAKLDGPPPALSDRFYLEYPTLTLLLFRLPFDLQPGAAALPPAVADSPQYAVAFFAPRSAAERRVWTALANAVRFYVAVMALGLTMLVVVVGRGYEPGAGWNDAVWLTALPGAVFFALNRFDVLPALATALAFASLGRGRRGWAGAWLAVGVLLKVYPVLFVPVVLRHLGPTRGVQFAAAFGGVLAAGFGLSCLLTDWAGTVGPIRVQLSRPLETGSWTLYGRLLPLELGHWREGRLAVLALAVLAAVAVRPADLSGVLRRCVAVLVAFVALAVFWSPQWVVWFLPLVVPLVPRTRWAYAAAVVTLDLLNYYAFPILFWNLWNVSDAAFPIVAEGVIYARAAAWAWLLGVVVRDEWRSRAGPVDVAAAVGAFREGRTALMASFVRRGAETRLPRGLMWSGAEPNGDPVFVRDRDTGLLVALLPVVVRFEPVAGSDMEDVPQAREPRPVVAVFTHQGGSWQTTGRAVFNLTAEQVIERSGGRYQSPRESAP